MSAIDSTAPEPTLVLFARGVIAILSAWPVMRLAVEESWGGPDSAAKRRWLAGAVVDEFQSPSDGQMPDAPYIEEMLLQVMQDEFEVDLDDDSGADVAKQITQLWSSGDVQKSTVEALEAAEQKAKSKRIVAQRAPGEDDDSSDEDDDADGDDAMDNDEAPQLVASTSTQREEPEVDDDGFTVVKKSNRTAR
ncbi:Pre-rRNA-processing protein TSR2-domain-containing protein [Auriculariales sp. MPI-PUGE-AT-0066]|nr:Pre-rRNA-processing protein TSR2-domain-containing protein [Auriculariales sp. MPI-PUGE-AT-0066]